MKKSLIVCFLFVLLMPHVYAKKINLNTWYKIRLLQNEYTGAEKNVCNPADTEKWCQTEMLPWVKKLKKRSKTNCWPIKEEEADKKGDTKAIRKIDQNTWDVIRHLHNECTEAQHNSFSHADTEKWCQTKMLPWVKKLKKDQENVSHESVGKNIDKPSRLCIIITSGLLFFIVLLAVLIFLLVRKERINSAWPSLNPSPIDRCPICKSTIDTETKTCKKCNIKIY